MPAFGRVALMALTLVPLNVAGALAATTPASGPPASWVAHHPITVIGPIIKPSAASLLANPPFSPAQIRKAYGIDQLAATGAGKTIAIVDAYGSPTIQQDLNAFCTQFGLPQLTITIAQPSGAPQQNTGWAQETSLDVEWAHAIAPAANILLVEAADTSSTQLLAAIDYANSHGANVVSMSWGGSEYPGEANDDSHFSQPGVTYFASSGDSGAGVSWPAVSTKVVGVGGTTLSLNSDGSYAGETAWSGSGGGVSAYVSEPAYQSSYPVTVTGGMRGVPDVAFDADPHSGVIMYYAGNQYEAGGTSLSAPCWAALYTLGSQTGVPWVYNQASASYAQDYHDITSGSNGYSAGAGYDLVTGLGSPAALSLLAPASKLSFTTQPSASNTAGVSFSAQPVVTIQDSSGNTVSGSAALVTIAITNGTGASGATLSGTLTVNAVAGVATFSGLSIDKAGTGYTLTATSAGYTLTTTSAAFNVAAGAASKLSFTTQPSASNTSGVAFGAQPVVAIQDSSGNTVTGSTAPVTIAITSGTGASGATLSGTLTVNAVAGVATFSGLSIDKAGTDYTLTATSTGLTSAASAAFNVAVGAASRLAFTTQPSASNTAGVSFGAQPVVTIQDSSGNTVTGSTAPVTIAITSGATLSGTLTVNAVAGVATFSGLSVDKAGTGYTLTATSTGLTSATSAAFNVAVGTATIDGQVTLQGGARPASGRVVSLTVKLFTPGANVMTDAPAATYAVSTVDSGTSTVTFQISAAPTGTWDVSVASPGALTSVKTGVILAAGSNTVAFGTLLEGDANGDGIINVTDFSILAASYMISTGQTGFDPRADFDDDGVVNILDFALLASNYLKTSPVSVP